MSSEAVERETVERESLERESMRPQRGLTIVEVLLSVALLTLIGFVSVGVITQIASAANNGYASARGPDGIDRELETLRGDATTAFAVFVPGSGLASEVDFYSKTDAGSDVFWRYRFDAAARSLRREDYDAAGTAGVRDPVTGAIDPRATYPPLPNVNAFTARTLQASALGSPSNVYGNVDTAMLGTGAHALPVSFDNGAVSRPDAFGGNTIVQIEIARAGSVRTLHLLSGTLPTGFTVHAVPVAHGVLYRIDQTHRFWFGLAQVSHTWIDGRVDVSYDRWRTRTTWCDFNIYGGQGGIDPRSPQANYDPGDFNESFAGLLARTQIEAACGAAPPAPASPAKTSAFTPPPDVVDTAPPCFRVPAPGRGRCWPAQAAPDWAPSPLPSDSPPPAWCLAHAISLACRPRSS